MHQWTDPQQEGHRPPVGTTMTTDIDNCFMKLGDYGEMYGNCRVLQTPTILSMWTEFATIFCGTEVGERGGADVTHC